MSADFTITLIIAAVVSIIIVCLLIGDREE